LDACSQVVSKDFEDLYNIKKEKLIQSSLIGGYRSNHATLNGARILRTQLDSNLSFRTSSYCFHSLNW
jgi:hypothetical protein